MPRDVNGNYTLPAGNPVVTATLVSSAWANSTLSDVALGLTNSLDRTGVTGGMLGQFRGIAGTAAAPGLSWTAEPTSGWYRNAAGDFRFSIAAVDILKLTTSGLTSSVDILPNVDTTYKLGSATFRWSSINSVAYSVPGANGAAWSASGIIPNTNNATPLGSATFSWSQLYLGVNNAPVLDTVSGNIGYFARTSFEITAGVTPTNFSYPPLHVMRYGADSLGVADSITAFNAASLIASTQGGGTVIIPGGIFKLAGTLLYYITPNLGQVVFQGAGKIATTLNYTGSASAVGVSAASTRIYDCGMRDLTIVNSGSATGLVGLDLDSVSTSSFTNLSIVSFPTAVSQHSTINGGCVYNRFYNVTAQMGATPTVGFLVDTKGSNANEFIACRYNGPNNTVGTAWKIVDANGCAITNCNIDLALVGFDLSAPAGAGFCDSNIIHSNRIEGVGTVFNLAVNVRFTQIGPNSYTSITTPIVDNGLRNNFLTGPFYAAYEQYQAAGQATGTRRFVSTSSIGANPFMVVQDTATSTVGSTVLQVETSSLSQTLIRARTASADKFTVSGAGDLGLHGNAPAAQVVGWGVPTGAGVVNNFPGATATLVQCSTVIAQIIADLKLTGRYGA